jgi:TetR/AcrR family transcriptional regulator
MGKVERKRQILEGAAHLFSSSRFDEVLMDDIALEAGVAKGTLYSYFSDKEELYFAVVFEGLARLNEQLQARAQRQTAPPETQLREIAHGLVSFLRQNSFFFQLMSIEDSKSETGKGINRKRWHEERRKQLAVIEAVLQQGAEQGVFDVRYPKTEARIFRDMVRSVLLGADSAMSETEMVEVILRIFLKGILKAD